MAFDPDAFLAEVTGGNGTDVAVTDVQAPPEPLRFRARATGYYPVGPNASEAERRMEGGDVGAGEWHGQRLRQQEPLYSLEDYQAGRAPYVSVAMDNSEKNPLTYGTMLHSPEYPGVPFRVMDTGSAFNGKTARYGPAKGLSRIDIRRGSRAASQQDNREIEFVVGEPPKDARTAYAMPPDFNAGPAIGTQDVIDDPSKMPPMWEEVERERMRQQQQQQQPVAEAKPDAPKAEGAFDPDAFLAAVGAADGANGTEKGGFDADAFLAEVRDPSQPMSREEFAAKWRQDQGRTLGQKVDSLTDGISKGARGVVQQVADAGSEMAGTPGALWRLPATVIEGLSRGTYDMGDMVRRAGNYEPLRAALAVANPATMLTPEGQAAVAAALEQDPEKVIDREYAQYLEDFGWQAQRAKGMDGKGNLAPTLIGEPLPKTAEASSLVLDPTVIVPAVSQASKAANFVRRVMSGAVKPVAEVAELAGRAVANGVEGAGERAAQAMTGAGMSVDGARTAARAAGVGALVTTPGQMAGAVYGGAKATEKAAQAAGAVAEGVLSAPSQLTVAERIARDASKPGWLRRAANTVAKLPEVVRTTPGLALEGAVQGAATGAALGVVTGQDAEGIGASIGSGGLLGAAGAVAGYHLPGAKEARRVAAENGDILWSLGRQVDLGGDVDRMSKLPREQLVQIASLQRVIDSTTDLVFVPREQFEAQGVRERAAGVYIDNAVDGRSRIVVNLDAHTNPARAVTHEVAHAILQSPVINKDPVRMAISQLYPEGKLDAMGREYARRTLEAERQSQPPTFPGGGKRPPVSPGEVEARFNELRQQAIDAGDIDGRDWIRDEVFAEHFASEMDGRGLKLDNLRRGVAPGADVSRLQESLMNARARVLQAFGVKFDQTGRVAQPTSQLFRDNPLLRSPEMQRMVGQVSRDRMRWLSGLAKRDESPETLKGAPLVGSRGVADLANSPAVEWRPNKDGFQETDFAVKTPEGRVVLKPEKEIAKVEEDRKTQARALVPSQTLPANSPDFGKKKIDGVEVIGGKTLPPQFDKYQSFTPATREAARLMEEKRNTGGTISVWYHQIGSGADGSWAKSVRKNLGNVRATQRELSLVSWHLSKAGNIYGHMLDVGAARARAFELQNQGKLDTHWGGNVDAFQRDVMTYLDNHANGRPGEAGIGVGKRDFINGFFGVTTKANKRENPVYSGKLGRTLIKVFRLDRMHNVQETGRTGWSVDYDKMKYNLHPDVPTAQDVSFRRSAPDPMRREVAPAPVVQDRDAAAELVRDTWDRLDYRNVPLVHAYNSVDEIPRVLGGPAAQQAAADGAIVEAFYFATPSGRRGMVLSLDGVARVAAERGITVEQRVQQLALHEATHHLQSVGALLPEVAHPRYQRIVDGVLSRVPEAELRDLAELYEFDPKSPEQRAKLAEEVLARFAEMPGERPGWVQRAIAELRELLRTVFPDLKWTDGDVQALLDSARRRANAEVAPGPGR